MSLYFASSSIDKFLLTLIFTVLGAAIGSFLNVCIDRVPAGKSLSYPPSQCDSCKHRLSPKDLIPIFSYLWLKWRCRYCGAKIPRRVFFMELGMSLSFFLLYWHYGLSIQLWIIIFYLCLFAVIALIDIEHKIIPNRITYPAATIAVALNLLPAQPGIISSLLGGTIGLALFFVLAIISRGGVGWGDVKLAGLAGLVTGDRLVFIALFVGVICGGVISVLLLLLKMKSRKEALPFGPFLSFGTMVALIKGSEILNFYISTMFVN